MRRPFWDWVDKNGPFNVALNSCCWVWIGAVKRGGYGKVTVNNRSCSVHRRAWELTHGQTAMHVLHKCDNRVCVNPLHLFLGTNQDNVDDRNCKLRQARHESHGAAKLTIVEVKEIRAKYQWGNGAMLSREYNVVPSTILDIVKGRKWRGVTR